MESSFDVDNLEVRSRSSEATRGRIAYHCCMDLKLGGWSHLICPYHCMSNVFPFCDLATKHRESREPRRTGECQSYNNPTKVKNIGKMFHFGKVKSNFIPQTINSAPSPSRKQTGAPSLHTSIIHCKKPLRCWVMLDEVTLNCLYLAHLQSLPKYGFTIQKVVSFLSKKIRKFNTYSANYETNTRYVCTYLNAFFVLIPDIVTKFQNVDIF